MDLREYNPDTRVRVNHCKPALRFHTKSGLFTINPTGVTLTGFKSGDRVVLLQDNKDPDVWYLSKVNSGKSGFVLRVHDKSVPGLLFNCCTTARAIAESVGMKKKYGTIRMANEPIVDNGRTLWVLITASLKPRIED